MLNMARFSMKSLIRDAAQSSVWESGSHGLIAVDLVRIAMVMVVHPRKSDFSKSLNMPSAHTGHPMVKTCNVKQKMAKKMWSLATNNAARWIAKVTGRSGESAPALVVLVPSTWNTW